MAMTIAMLAISSSLAATRSTTTKATLVATNAATMPTAVNEEKNTADAVEIVSAAGNTKTRVASKKDSSIKLEAAKAGITSTQNAKKATIQDEAGMNNAAVTDRGSTGAVVMNSRGAPNLTTALSRGPTGDVASGFGRGAPISSTASDSFV